MKQEKFAAYDSLKCDGFTVLKCRAVKKLIEKYVELALPSMTRLHYRLLKLQVKKTVEYSYDCCFQTNKRFQKEQTRKFRFQSLHI